MKIIHNSPIHNDEKSHDFYIIKIGETTFFLTYQAYNAAEKFDVEIFNGKEKSYLLSIYDLGETPNSSMYVCSKLMRKERSKCLFEKAVRILEKFI